MKYPANYIPLHPEESTYLTGGTAIDAFNKIIGQEFEKQFLSSFRSAVWKCLNKESTRPLLDWGMDFWKMSLSQKAAFLYGGFLVVQNVVEYWEK